MGLARVTTSGLLWLQLWGHGDRRDKLFALVTSRNDHINCPKHTTRAILMSTHLDVSTVHVLVCVECSIAWDGYPQRAISIVNGAIEEDVKQNYAEALKQYQFSLDYFVLALKCAYYPMLFRSSDLSVLDTDEKNAKLKILICAKIEEYLARAETLKSHVKDKQPKKAISASGPGATANGDKK